MSWRSPHGTPLPSWRERTLLMGILNLTPDSFSDGGQLATPEDALRQAEALIAAGADVLDLGAESTRPGSHPVEARAELDRLLPTLRLLRRRLPKTPLSIDTYKADVAAAALAEGADLINDVEEAGTTFRETNRRWPKFALGPVAHSSSCIGEKRLIIRTFGLNLAATCKARCTSPALRASAQSNCGPTLVLVSERRPPKT